MRIAVAMLHPDSTAYHRGHNSGVSASRKDRDYVAIAVLLAIYFGAYFVLSIFETIGLPLTMDEFSWSPADVRFLFQARYTSSPIVTPKLTAL